MSQQYPLNRKTLARLEFVTIKKILVCLLSLAVFASTPKTGYCYSHIVAQRTTDKVSDYDRMSEIGLSSGLEAILSGYAPAVLSTLGGGIAYLIFREPRYIHMGGRVGFGHVSWVDNTPTISAFRCSWLADIFSTSADQWPGQAKAGISSELYHNVQFEGYTANGGIIFIVASVIIVVTAVFIYLWSSFS